MEENTAPKAAPPGSTSSSPVPVRVDDTNRSIIQVGGVEAVKILDSTEIDDWVASVAAEICGLMHDQPSTPFTLVCVHQGAARLFAELRRQLVRLTTTLPMRREQSVAGFGQQHIQAYHPATGEPVLDVRWIDLEGGDASAPDLTGHTVIVVDDVVRTCETLQAVVKAVRQVGATEVLTMALCRQRELEHLDGDPLELTWVINQELGYGNVFGYGVALRATDDPDADPMRHIQSLYVQVGGAR